MGDTDFTKWIITLGVGGVLAGFMFFFYRKDMTHWAELWKGQSDALISVVKENTAAITKAITLMEALHRRLDREEADREKLH